MSIVSGFIVPKMFPVSNLFLGYDLAITTSRFFA